MLTQESNRQLTGFCRCEQLGQQITKFHTAGVLNIGTQNADIDPKATADFGYQRRVDTLSGEAQAQQRPVISLALSRES